MSIREGETVTPHRLGRGVLVGVLALLTCVVTFGVLFYSLFGWFYECSGSDVSDPPSPGSDQARMCNAWDGDIGALFWGRPRPKGPPMARDAAEFSEYVSLRWPPMLRTARLLTGDDGLAEDLVQTALERCYVAWPRLRARSAVDSYVRRAIVNTFISWQRRRSWHEVPQERIPESVGVDATAEVPARSMLQAALAELSARQRAVVVLRFYEDLSVQQVAAELNCSAGTVKSQTSDALANLRSLLGDDLDEADTDRETEERRRR